MTRERFTENLLMYPGMALMVASVIWFYLAGLLSLPAEVVSDELAYALYQMTLVRDALAIFVIGATMGLSGLGLAAFHAGRNGTQHRQESSDMWKPVLTGVLLIAAGAQASTLEELRQLEAHKTTPGKASQVQTAVTSSSPVAPAVPERRDYRLPDGRVVNLKNYKLVLFMQSRCGYCQQFDPLLKRVTAQMGLDVFPYTLDGMGDASFPDAIPATEAVIRDMWSNMRPVTPAAFLVEVNTLKTLPLLYGIVDERTLRQRIDEGLGFAVSAKGKHEIMKKQK